MERITDHQQILQLRNIVRYEKKEATIPHSQDVTKVNSKNPLKKDNSGSDFIDKVYQSNFADRKTTQETPSSNGVSKVKLHEISFLSIETSAVSRGWCGRTV